MKRRFGMWMGILLILIVGVSVTKMTRDFVVSQGVAASSILNVADAADLGAMAGGGVSGGSVPETHMEIQMAAPDMAVAGAADGVPERNAESPMEAAPPVISEDAAEEGSEVTAEAAMEETAEAAAEIAEVTEDKSEPVAGMTGGPGAAVPGVNSTASAPGGPGAWMDEEPMEAGPGAPTAYSEEAALYSIRSSGKTGPANNEAIQETVKSPLDPVVETDVDFAEEEDKEVVLTAADFFDRFILAEESCAKIWEKTTPDNMIAYNAAAEQERVLWDYELNLIYSEIRSRMSMEEAEKLKYLELEWLKERDHYAEKAAAKSSMMNVQKQDPVYIRALAEKTKERCYWLVAEYEELLNQEKIDGMKKK